MPKTIHAPARIRFACLLLAILFLTALPAFGQTAVATEAPSAGPVPILEACDDGVVKDDGSVETGYGWVPSVIEGIYVQKFDTSEIPSPVIDQVCLCFLRTREDASIDFEVVFYRDVDGNPEEEPFAAFPATLDDIPEGVIGKFAEIPTPGVLLPPFGTFYVGARWDASVDQFFFVCDDSSEETERVNIWFRDDRAEGWDNADETNDPLFEMHRALLVRPVGSLIGVTEIPMVGGHGMALLAALLLAAGIAALRRLAA